MKTRKRLLSAALAFVMTLGLLPAMAPSALAAEDAVEGDLSSVSAETLQNMGFSNVDPAAMAEKAAAAVNDNPVKRPISTYTINELMLGTSGNMHQVKDMPNIKDKGGDGNYLYPNGQVSNYVDMSKFTIGIGGGLQTARSVALDMDGDGRKNYTASLILRTNGDNYTGYDLFLWDENGAGVGRLYAPIPSWNDFGTYIPHAGAVLAITGGDYDGDGIDEIAVYTPCGGGNRVPQIVIYAWDGKYLNKKTAMDLNLSTTGLSFFGEGRKDPLPREWPSVSLTTVENTEDGCDDIAVGVSYMRYGNTTLKDTDTIPVSSIVFWKSPLKAGIQNNVSHELLNERWTGGKYSIMNEEDQRGGYFETMMFPGVASGDIDGDGLPDVVAAGYRVNNAKTGNYTWELDRERYLITYYSLQNTAAADAEPNFQYVKRSALQWISLRPGDYGGKAHNDDNGATNLNEGWDNDNDSRSRILDPLTLAVFSERGTGYADSVFVNGFVVSLGLAATTSGVEGGGTQQDVGNPANNAAPADGNGNSWKARISLADTTNMFYTRYAAPLRGIDTWMISGNINDRSVMEAAVGNFDGNVLGREQVVFTYIVQQQNRTESFYTYVCALGLTGDATVDTTHKATTGDTWKNGWKQNINGVKFEAYEIRRTSKDSYLTVCAPDVDHDSVISRPATDENGQHRQPDFFFSDPQIIAVLQAAPYFGELNESGGLTNDMETSITKTQGTTTSFTEGVSITTGPRFGFGVEIDGGPAVVDMNLFAMENIISVNASAGWSFEKTTDRSVSTTFQAAENDAVALTMTPYIRHYYETWDPDKAIWELCTLDMPEAPQTASMDLDLYDEMAAQNGWATLRDNPLILGNSKPGYPATYRAAKPSGVRWNGSVADDKQATGDFIRVGAAGGGVTKTIGDSISHANGVTWGASVSQETMYSVVVVKAGWGVEAEYTGGYMQGTYSGSEYSGSVPDVNKEYVGKYSFQWDFGTYMADLDVLGNGVKQKVPVLAYLVRSVQAPPRAPLDLAVDTVTADSVTLSWTDEVNPSPDSYEVWLRQGSESYYVGAVNADNETRSYTYTDADLASAEDYTYYVTTRSYLGDRLASSEPSLSVTARTRVAGGIALTDPKDQTADVGETATFRVSASNASSPRYQWQTRAADAAGWSDLAGKTAGTLTVTPLRGDDGRQYRCKVSARTSGGYDTAYSGPATLTVTTPGTVTTLTKAAPDSDYGYIMENYAVGGREAPSYPEATVTATQGNASYTVMALTAPAAADGDNPTTVYYLAKYNEANNAMEYFALSAGDQTAVAQAIAERRALKADSLPEAAVTVTLQTQPTAISSEQLFYSDEAHSAAIDGYTAALLEADGTAGENPAGTVFENGLTTLSYTAYTSDGKTVYAADVKSTDVAEDAEGYVRDIRYYKTGETDGSYARIYLGAVSYKAGESPLTGFDPVKLTTATAPMKQMVIVNGQTALDPGTPLELKVAVTADSDTTPTGTVQLTFRNETTGSTMTRQCTLKADGTASYALPFNEPGAYTVTAAYPGADLLDKSDSEPLTFTVYGQHSDWLELKGAAAAKVGETLTLTPYRYEPSKEDGEQPVGSLIPPESAQLMSYSVRKDNRSLKAGTDYTMTTSTDPMRATFTFPRMGVYEIGLSYWHPETLTAVYAGKQVVVSGQDATLSTPDELTFTEDVTPAQIAAKGVQVAGVSDSAVEKIKEVFILSVEGAEETSETEPLPVGAYPVRVTVAEDKEAAYTALLEQYNFVQKDGTAIVTKPQVNVYYAARGEGGRLEAVQGGMTLAPGGRIFEKTEATFTAVPEKGWQVDTWEVYKKKGETTTPTTVEAGALTVTVTAEAGGQADIYAYVTFKKQEMAVTFGAAPADGGIITARLNDEAGTQLRSGDAIKAGDKVYFEAAPAEGRSVAGWTLNGTPLKNADGQDFTGLTYTTDALYGAADLTVQFKDGRAFAVDLQAIDENGAPSPMGAVTHDGKVENGLVSATSPFTVTAAPAPGYQVAEWRCCEGGGYTVLQGNALTYEVTRLTKDLDLRVVFTREKSYTVSFGPAGKVTANDGASLTSGDKSKAGAAITFTAVPETNTETAYWTVNGEVQPAEGNTFTITALSSDVDVQAVFQAVPTVRFTAAPGNGSVAVTAGGSSVSDGAAVPYGSEVAVTLTPSGNFEAATLTVNGAEVLANAVYADGSGAATDERVYTFPVSLRQEYVIEAAFAEIPSVQVSFSADNGSVIASYIRKGATSTSDSPVTAYRDGAVTLTAMPEDNYRLTGWTLNGAPVGDGSDTLVLPITADVTENQTVAAVTEAVGAFITFETLGDGTIEAALTGEEALSFESGNRLAKGENIILTVTPDNGWTQEAWLVNGVVQAGATGETFSYANTAGGGAHIAARLTREAAVTFGGENGIVTAEANGMALSSGDTVPFGAAVTFRAFPDRGYGFTEWGGHGTNAVLTLTADGDLDVTARFDPAETCVITFANPAGGIMSAKKGSDPFESGGTAAPGDVISFTVAPEADQAVSSWSNNGVPESGNGSTYDLTVTGDHQIAAVTTPTGYTVTYGVEGDGGAVSGSVVSGGTAAAGSTVTLTAAPESGKMVEGWYLDGSGTAEPGSKGRGAYTIDALYRNVSVKVKFTEEIKPQLTIVIGGDGAGTVKASVNGSAPQAVTSGTPLTLAYGDAVLLTAAPQNTYNRFDGWTGDATSNSAALNLGAVTESKSVTATFTARTQVKLTVAWPTSEGSVAAQAGYGALADLNITNGAPVTLNPGQKIALTAAPSDADKIARWTVDGVEQSGLSNTLTIDSLERNTTVAVVFVDQPVQTATVTIGSPPGGSISVTANGNTVHSGGSVPVGTVLTLTATADANYIFSGWSGAVSGAANPATYTVLPADAAAGITISAVFQYSGGGGGGGGGTAAQPPKEEDKTVVDDRTGDGLIRDAVEGGKETIRIDADTPKVSLPAGFLTGAGDRTNADILITTSVASIRLPNGALGGLASLGGEITVQATLEKNADGKQMLTLGITADGKAVGRVPGGVRVTVPYPGGTSNTVAVLDGKVLPKSFAQGGHMTVPLDGPAAVVLTDNPKRFPDTQGHWGRGYIDFVTSHELFQGTGDGVFAADATMTRGMLWTVLARMEGADTAASGGAWYAPGMDWAQKAGVSDGSNPEGDITREQLAVMLWRAAGSPTPSDTLEGFTDAGGVSKFAEEAMRWAVERGILTGKGDGSLDPLGSATRAEVAAMLERFILSTAP